MVHQSTKAIFSAPIPTLSNFLRQPEKNAFVDFYRNVGVLFFFLFFFSMVFSQTFTPLSPTGDGGFENGQDFTTNGWTPVQPDINRRWYARDTPTPYNGSSRAAYVGAANNYNGSNTAGVFHFYRDITIPVGATNVNLNFYYKQPTRDNGNDVFTVYTTTTANTPVSGTVPGTGYVTRYTNTANTYSNWTAVPTIDLSSLAGTTIRLVFTFRNNGSNPIANPAVDNISLTYVLTPCTGTPTGGTTALSPTTGAPSSIFIGTVSGSSTGSDFTFQWQMASSAGGPWTDIAGKTSHNASISAVSLPNTTRYYRRRMRCTNSGAEAFSAPASFTTNSVSYCTPTSQVPNGVYINSV